jgi:hypothetical protein
VRRALALALALSGCRSEPPPAREGSVVDAPPADRIGIEARFDDRVSLAGYRLEPRRLTHRAGSRVALTLLWSVDAPLEEGFARFTHLLDDAGRMIDNLDAPADAFSPARWPAGKVVLERIEVPLSADAPERVTLAVGFYRGKERLAAEGGGVDAQRQAALIKLRVEGSREPEVPALLVPRLKGELRIDGRLDEPAWRAAASTGRFVDVRSGHAAKGPFGAEARLVYDASFLYLGMSVEDVDLQGGFSPAATDPHLWTSDTVELMIDPEGDGDNRDYFEIQIGPQNLVFDSRFDDYNQPRGGPDGPFGHQAWSAKLDSAVSLDGTLDDGAGDRGYVVEARIPLSSLEIEPQAGDRWRINLYALDRSGLAVAWSPILGRGNFHRASRFGRIELGASTTE